MIKKKSTLEGVFEFLHLDPQLDQNLKPIRHLSEQFFYIHLSIYGYSA